MYCEAHTPGRIYLLCPNIERKSCRRFRPTTEKKSSACRSESFSTQLLVVSCFSRDRQKFKRKKARNTEKERQRRDRQRRSSSPSRASPSSSRRPRSGTDTEKRDRGESRRAGDDARSPKREKRRSSRTHANKEEGDNRRSKARGGDSSRRKRDDKLESDRTRGDGAEGSKHRSRRRRRDDESRKGGETRSSSRGHGKTSDRHRDDGGSTRAHGSEAEHGHGHRHSKRSQRRGESDRDEDRSSGRHHGRDRDEIRRTSTHGSGDGSDPAQSPKEGAKHSTSGATDDDSEAGVDGWVSVSPGRKASSSSRGQTRGKAAMPESKGKRDKDAAGEYTSEGEEDLPQQSKDGGRHGRGGVIEEHPLEDLISAQEGIDLARSRRDAEDRKGETHTTSIKIEPSKDVKKRMDHSGEKGLAASSGRLENVREQRENKRNTHDIGRGPERDIAVEASTRSWNDNDLEVHVSYRGMQPRFLREPIFTLRCTALSLKGVG